MGTILSVCERWCHQLWIAPIDACELVQSNWIYFVCGSGSYKIDVWILNQHSMRCCALRCIWILNLNDGRTQFDHKLFCSHLLECFGKKTQLSTIALHSNFTFFLDSCWPDVGAGVDSQNTEAPCIDKCVEFRCIRNVSCFVLNIHTLDFRQVFIFRIPVLHILRIEWFDKSFSICSFIANKCQNYALYLRACIWVECE